MKDATSIGDKYKYLDGEIDVILDRRKLSLSSCINFFKLSS